MRAQTAEQLEEYRRKRDFGVTPEPSGDAAPAAGGRLYVMHHHAASHDHFDLRLEHMGVLKSWALPKGASLKPGEKRLAVEVEDHPLEYGAFEGVIPKGEYGGGTVMLWDAGSWRVNGKHDDNHIDFILDGEKLKGAWTLVRTRGSGKRAKPGKSWLMIKRSDGRATPLDPDDTSVATGRTMEQIAKDRDNIWRSKGTELPAAPQASKVKGARKAALGRDARPQLASLVAQAPAGDHWIHEIKFDGYRVMARIDKGRVRLTTRNGHDWTERFQLVADALARLPAKTALLDGEVVVLDADGSTNFGKLQESLSAGRSGGFVYMAFDLLHLDGYDLTAVAQLERKRVLADLVAASGFGGEGAVRYSDHVVGQGPALHAQACELGLEGIIAKKADAPYRAGRGKSWLKVKCTEHQEFVVGGWTDPGGARTGFGSLLLGAFDDKDRLVYAGRVGTGFNTRQLESLLRRMRKLEAKQSPFADPVTDAKTAHWIRPEMVVEVEFTERTRDGRLRHPTWRGLREDRDAQEIRWTGEAIAGEEPMEPGTQAATTTVRRVPGEAEVAGVRITHPERVMFPEMGVTKLDLARYYEDIAEWVMPHIARRPLTLVRCPTGREGECFFQKHLGDTQARSVPRVGFRESSGVKEYAYAEDVSHLVALVQAGVLEFHPFGCRTDDLEHPDLIVFDLDPSPGVSWTEIMRVTRELKARVEDYGLATFLRTTGGKGLHIVVPLKPKADWEQVKGFAQAVSEQHAADDPKRLTTNMSKAKRRGKIFIDYLRNSRGATAIASYSVRAREGAPVSVPVRWNELGAGIQPGRYHVGNIRRRLGSLREDPWAGFFDAALPLDATRLKKAGLK